METETFPDPHRYDQSYGGQGHTEQQPYMEHQPYAEQAQPEYRSPRTTTELDVATGVKQKRPRRAPLTMTALVVIGVVAIVLGPSLIWAYSLTVRPDEAAATMPQQSEAVTISVTSGMLAMVAGFAIGQHQGRSGRDNDEEI